MGKDLARTRVMRVTPEQIQVGPPAIFTPAAMEERGVRAVGKYRDAGNGQYAVPVVYVGRRHLPFHERHRKGIVAAGASLALLSALALMVMWVGPAWFFGGITAMAVVIAALVRWSRGGGASASVTTTTTTKVRVR